MGETSRIATNATFLTISKTISLVVSMIVSMILSRVSSLEEYGSFSQIMLVVNLFAAIFMLGLPNSLNYFISVLDSDKEKKDFISTYFIATTLLSFLMGVSLTLALPLFVRYFKNPLLYSVFFCFLIYPWASILVSNVENLFVAYGKTKYLNVYRIVSSLLLVASILVPVLIGWSFRLYLILYLVSYSLLAIFVYCSAIKFSGGIQFKVSLPLLKRTLRYSLPIGLATIVGTLNLEIDKLLIGYFVSTEEMAIYTNAAKELPITIISASISAVLIPQIVMLLKKGKNNSAIKIWSYSIELSFMFICLIALGVFVFAEDVMSMLYSSKYLAGSNIFRVYSLVLLLRATYYGTILSSVGKTKPIFICSLISLFLNVVLNFVFFFAIGILGPSIATFISILVTAFVQLIYTCKYTKTSFKRVFPWKRLFIIIAVNSLLGFFFFTLKKTFPSTSITTSFYDSFRLGLLWSFIVIIVFRKRIKFLWANLNNSDKFLEEK